MVTIVPKENDWSDTFRSIGEAGTGAYMHHADEKAIQKAITDLGPNPAAKDVLGALTNVKTYSHKAKQNALESHIGVQKFEEAKRHAAESEKILKEKNRIAGLATEQKKAAKEAEKLAKEAKADEDFARKKNAAVEMVKNSTLDDAVKARLIPAIEEGKLDPAGIESLVKQNPEKKLTAIQEKQKERKKDVKLGLKTIDRMEEINKKGNLGRGSGYSKYISGHVAKDFGEYERYGKSLIQLGTKIVIRNRAEFETLSEDLFDPTIPDAQREGILNSLKNLLEDELKEGEEGTQEVKKNPLSKYER